MTDQFSIVALDRFIQATRDSGYKGTVSSISELVDNSLQAGASWVRIRLDIEDSETEHPIVLRISDNGRGMDAATLRQALRFGGSSRFNDRSGLGRYGMGLPNSSFSQAQRVTVQTWTEPDQVLSSYLDLDEIASGELTVVPEPVGSELPESAERADSGTVVTWSRCDRLDNRRISTLTRKLLSALGRKFRHHLWRGVELSVNGEAVRPFDPLYLSDDSVVTGAAPFGEELVYEVAADPADPSRTGFVRVRFSELPVAEWSRLSNQEKRARGVAKGAGVSIVRAGREVDYGWFFLAGKRRENYDDWWRCEIAFEPVLDEAFGITHTKQQIRPLPHLVEALSGDMEAAARALNSRARRAHQEAKLSERFSASEQRASQVDGLLKPLPPVTRPADARVLEGIGVASDAGSTSGAAYRIVPKSLSSTAFFTPARDAGRTVLVLNPHHPFYKQVYRPLLESEGKSEATVRGQLELLLLAAARSEAALEDEGHARAAQVLRESWSDTLSTFLNG